MCSQCRLAKKQKNEDSLVIENSSKDRMMDRLGGEQAALQAGQSVLLSGKGGNAELWRVFGLAD